MVYLLEIQLIREIILNQSEALSRLLSPLASHSLMRGEGRTKLMEIRLELIINIMRKIVASANLTLRLKHQYTPVSNYEIQKKVNPIVSVAIGSDREKLFDLHFRLFENTVPRTSENFKRLLLGTASYKGRALSLIGNHFHSAIPRAYAELGHLPGGNCSIYGPTFRDESFELPHDRPGLLSCVTEENTNNSRFIITFAPTPFLDLRYTVFGQITAQTIHHLRTLERLSDKIENYKILSSQLVEVAQDSHDHDHGHGHH